MTTVNQAREAIYARFVAQWGTTTPLTFDAEGFDPPQGQAWVRLSVRHNRSNQESLGPINGRKFERGGQIALQVFTPLDDRGLRDSDVLVQQARGIFEGVTFSGVRVYDAVHSEIGPDGDFFQVNLDADFEYEEQK